MQFIIDNCINIRYILYRKYAIYGKILMRLTEKEVIQSLKRTSGLYAPLVINRLREQVSFQEGYRADAIIEFSIENGLSFEAVVETAPVATPENILKRARVLVDFLDKVKKPNIVPVVVAPYIGAKQAQLLMDKDISWIDLCGNMRVSVPGKIYIEKKGNRNKFPDTSPIKKIFEGTSSLVSRALLLKPRGFKSQYELVDFINSRNASITAGTVSRVLKSLEEELLVRRDKSLIRLTDSEKLLDCLSEGYKKSSSRRAGNLYKYVCENPKDTFYTFFERGIEYLACGFYAAKIKGLALTDKISIYVKSIDDIQKASNRNWIKIEPDAEFGNLNIIETDEPSVWFNTKIKLENPVVDDIELYLEMMDDMPRGPKVAEILKERILKVE